MDVDSLYDFLIEAQRKRADLVVTFSDQDEYLLKDIDFCYSMDWNGQRDEEPLKVEFEQCLIESNGRRHAEQVGRNESAGVYWTSQNPIEPVGISYAIQDVVKVWDEINSYYLYEKSI